MEKTNRLVVGKPQPSLFSNLIHEDERGEIYLLKGSALKEHEEITIFTCKQNFARGGCIHMIHDEHCVVLEGKIEYHNGDKTYIMRPGECITILKNTPHYFIAKTDSIVMEFGATPDEKKCKHLETRKKVDAINAEKIKMDNWMK